MGILRRPIRWYKFSTSSLRRNFVKTTLLSCQSLTFPFLIFILVVAVFALLGVHSLDSAGRSATVGRLEAEVDVLLRVETHNERRDVDELLAHADVTLTDQHASVMDRFRQAEFEDLSLETALKEILDAETQNVIEFHFRLVQYSDTHQTTQEGVTFEESSRVLLLEREQDTSGFTDLGEGELDAPDFAFVAKTEFADELQLLIQTLLLKGTTRRRVRLGRLIRQTTHFLDFFFNFKF